MPLLETEVGQSHQTYWKVMPDEPCYLENNDSIKYLSETNN